MKYYLILLLKIILYPLYYCHQVIMDAPVLCCSNELFGFSEANHDGFPDASCGSRHASSRSETGWVCQTR